MELGIYQSFSNLQKLAQAVGAELSLPRLSDLTYGSKAQLVPEKVCLKLTNRAEGEAGEEVPTMEYDFDENGAKECKGVLEAEMALMQIAQNAGGDMTESDSDNDDKRIIVEKGEVNEDVDGDERQKYFWQMQQCLMMLDNELDQLKRDPLLDERVEDVLVVMDDRFVFNRIATDYDDPQIERKVGQVRAAIHRYQGRLSVLRQRQYIRECFQKEKQQLLADTAADLRIETEDDERAYLLQGGRQIGRFEYTDLELIRLQEMIKHVRKLKERLATEVVRLHEARGGGKL